MLHLRHFSSAYKTYDLIVVGGGILGMSAALNTLQTYRKLKVAVVEKECKLGKHQTGRNSGVIHCGVYYKPGSLKAELCRKGAELAYDYCRRKNIPFKKCGKLIVATNRKEVGLLSDLYERGLHNKVDGLKLIANEEIRELEPSCENGRKAIWSPNTGIVDWSIVNEHFAHDFANCGGDIILNFEVNSFRIDENPIVIRSKCGQMLRSRFILTCCGLQSDFVAKLTGCSPNPKIIPFRGEYLILKKSKQHLIRTNLYPVPDPRLPFLGVHFTPKIDGSVWIGPNAVFAFKREGYRWTDFDRSEFFDSLKYPGFSKLCSKYINFGIHEIMKSLFVSLKLKDLQKLVPSITLDDVETGPSGVRAQALDFDGNLVDDFVFDQNERILHCRNAPSPAATSSLAIAQVITSKLNLAFLPQRKFTQFSSIGRVVHNDTFFGHLHVTFDVIFYNSQMLKKYDARLRPMFGIEPLAVGMDLTLVSFDAISEVNMDYTITIFLNQYWRDERLAFGTRDLLTLSGDFLNKIWLPDTFFANDKNSFMHDVTESNKLLRINGEGRVTYGMRFTTTLACMMDLHNYPLDTQNCTVEIESYGYTVKDVKMYWKPKAIRGVEDANIPQFSITDWKTNDREESLATGIYQRLSLSFKLQRNIGYFVFQTYLPSVLIVMLSWISFWINYEATSARVALGITTVLTMTTISTGIRGSLPKISYIKAIDIYLSMCFIFVFAALLEYAAVNYTYWGSRAKKKPKQFVGYYRPKVETNVENESNLSMTTDFDFEQSDQISPILSIRNQCMDEFIRNENTFNDPAKFPPSFRFVSTPKPAKSKIITSVAAFQKYKPKMVTVINQSKSAIKSILPEIQNVHEIDEYSRIFFPVTFIFFNVCYWFFYTIFS